MSIKVLIADDHKIVRDGLRSLLEREPDINIVAEADNGRMAVQIAHELLPDVVLMDMSMPEMNGIEATRRIAAEMPGIRVIALSMHSNRHFVVEALNAGAKGYLLKDCAFEDLAVTIRTVTAKDDQPRQKMAGIVISDHSLQSQEPPPLAGALLSSREREVLQLIAEGKNTKAIAFTLEVSIKTVETHRQNIMGKLNLHSIAELTKYAIREGLTTVD